MALVDYAVEETRFRPGGGPKFPSWKRAALVTAERIADERYEAEGPPAVLEPTF